MKAKERYRLVMQGSGAGIWDWDIVRQRVYYSPQWKRTRGCADEDVGDTYQEWASASIPKIVRASKRHLPPSCRSCPPTQDPAALYRGLSYAPQGWLLALDSTRGVVHSVKMAHPSAWSAPESTSRSASARRKRCAAARAPARNL